MPLRCIALDDEPLALELIRRYASRVPDLELAETFTDAVAARSYLQAHPVDLLFIDIQMPDINGLELVRGLPERPLVIFTTAYRNYAADSYELDAVDYLVKPFEEARFERAVQKAVQQKQLREGNTDEPATLFVRSGYQLVPVHLDEIEYIESVEDYLKIYLQTGRPVMTLMTLKAMLEKLPPAKFRRIHRSYIVALARIRSVVNRKVRLTQAELPVGDSYLSFLKEWTRK
ncbi:MAG TPA: LytTR family DNA-binding domain-containing protein [Chitinophagaceae bacterium]|jgi:DNA-binding LytR/AlgR family response regulator|nr:LytTR family DNA-binding domain-containing protein [Chitinophagaceae bacterium]